MRISFRQGIVRRQTDVAGNPTFLRKSGNAIDLVVSPDPTILAFADGPEDYLHEEKNTILSAWTGPFTPPHDYWLYVDIDILTAVRTFGQTTVKPIFSNTEPQHPAQDQHWFDLRDTTMKVRKGNKWQRRLRVFVGSLNNAGSLKAENLGSQVSLNTPVRAGFILFDSDDEPVQKGGEFNRRKFLTTESPISTQMSGAANFNLESAVQVARARTNMPAFTAVYYIGPKEISYADPFLRQPAAGIINEEAHAGEVVRVVSTGFIEDETFSWSAPPGTPLFVGTAGELTTIPSQTFSIQQIGRIVSSKVIQVELGPFILYL